MHTTTRPHTTHTDPVADDAVPLAVWPCAQTSAQYQREGRYLPESFTHPGKMLPELARRIVTAYSHPGQLVLDPMCGIGTTLLEAAALDRRVIGVDVEDRWARIAIANCEHALNPRQQRNVEVVTADARQLPATLANLAGTVDLIVVSPPYACTVGTLDPSRWNTGRDLCDQSTLNYGASGNLGHARGRVYEHAMAAIYAGCFEVLRPGGMLVTVTKNTRHKGQLFDLAGLTRELCEQVGFGYLQHVIALLAAVRDGDLAGRPSVWQRIQTRKALDRGERVHLISHEDVLVFTKPQDGNR